MKSFRENFDYYKRRITLILLLIVLILGVHGLYVYYRPRILHDWQLVSAMLYGTMKLFLFSPPLMPDADVTIGYEIAKWVAPMLTSALVLTAVTKTFYHSKNALLNYFSKRHVVIFGYNPKSIALMENMRRGAKPWRISCISDCIVPAEEAKNLEKRGIAVYYQDITKLGDKELRSFLNGLRIQRSPYLLFTGKVDLFNFTALMQLMPHLHPKDPMAVLVQMGSSSMAEFLFSNFQEKVKLHPDLSKVDLSVYDDEELTVRLLLSNMEEHIARTGLTPLRRIIEDKKASPDIETMIETIRAPHFLILGYGKLLPHLLLALANDAVLSLREKTKITILERGKADELHSFLQKNEELYQAIDIEVQPAEVRPRAFLSQLTEIREGDLKVSYILLPDEDVGGNLELLSSVQRIFPDIPIALRNMSGYDIAPVIQSSPNPITVFGDLAQIMTPQIVLRQRLDDKAKDFNASYGLTSELLGKGGGSPWEQLSYVKKRSSRASAAHGSLKEEFLKVYYPDLSPGEIRALLKERTNELQALESANSDDPIAYHAGFCAYLSDYPELDYLSRLEHMRWCNSYYAMGFKLGPTKDEYKKEHNCLIDDWSILMDEAFSTCHPEYDLISALALFQENEDVNAHGKL
ncbi:MAG: hypothetical protein Q4G61_05945 [Tissierellia bacterium]|nr:hypothetical protein [Tissierellia bacterium]